MSLKGKIKWFNEKKSYGFIEREDKERDVFVHHNAVKDAGLKCLISKPTKILIIYNLLLQSKKNMLLCNDD